jgi:FERM N-terminal domain
MQKELLGQSLLEVVFNRLNLLETAYFGLRYLDFEGQTVSIKNEKKFSILYFSTLLLAKKE